jgi:Zn-dependent peptidase ImmA (M78 family)
MKEVEINVKRIEHLLSLYGLTREELLEKINESRSKRPLSEEKVFNLNIDISTLKQIDKIFKKGLSYYVDPSDPIKSEDESIFFRKSNFNANLDIESKQLVQKFEEEKLDFSYFSKLSELDISRKIPTYTTNDSAYKVAVECRKTLYPKFDSNQRTFLKNLIEKLGDSNILVFEHIESSNLKKKSNIEGFFLKPNVIVLKRQQKGFRREIFTLAHELGHYLLLEEEIDNQVYSENNGYENLSIIERWCNDFAFYFLSGQYATTINNLKIASKHNDYYHDIVEDISRLTHLSSLSIYTRFLIANIVNFEDYQTITKGIRKDIKEWEEAEREKQNQAAELAKLQGKPPGFGIVKPIISPLYLRTLRNALYDGNIGEMEFCTKLNLKNSLKIDEYLV